MICLLSARRLKPGVYDDFRRAWEPERWPPEAIAPITCATGPTRTHVEEKLVEGASEVIEEVDPAKTRS